MELQMLEEITITSHCIALGWDQILVTLLVFYDL